MKILTRYMVREFFKIFTITLFALVSVYLIIDIFEKIDDLTEHGALISVIIEYFVMETPSILSQMIPFAVLFATILTLGISTRDRETMAIYALGISPTTIIIPIIVSSFIVGLSTFFLNDSIIPKTNKRFEMLKKVWVEGRSPEIVFKQYRVWMKTRDGIYNIRLIDPDGRVLKGLTFFGLSDDGYNIDLRMDAKEAIWDDDRWVGIDTKIIRFDRDNIKSLYYKKTILPIYEKPEDIQTLKASSTTMNFLELKDYIHRIEEEGYSSAHYRVDLYNKLSIPFASMVMALIGIPFGLKRFRGGIPFGITISIVLGFSYWVIEALSTSLGYGEVLPPLVASILPAICFASIGGLLLLHTIGE